MIGKSGIANENTPNIVSEKSAPTAGPLCIHAKSGACSALSGAQVSAFATNAMPGVMALRTGGINKPPMPTIATRTPARLN